MVSAYTAFANKGIRVAPLFVTKIEDSEGNVLATFSPQQMEEVISASSAYKMLVMLRAVINEGTGGRVRRYGITADMGGKTGTTNRNSDGWFMGFTPSLVSGCWVGGGEERDIHFDPMTYGQGASLALPILDKNICIRCMPTRHWDMIRKRLLNCLTDLTRAKTSVFREIAL